MSVNLDDDAILDINGVVCCCNNNRVTKSGAINLLKKNDDLTKKSRIIFIYIYKNGQKIITFGWTEIEKHRFHKRKNPTSIFNVDVNEILVSNKDSLDKYFKYFIVY